MQRLTEYGDGIASWLRRKPLARGVVYLGASAAILELMNTIATDLSDSYTNMHVPAFPCVVALTYGFARLRPEDAAAWQKLPTGQNVADLGRGTLLGSAAILTVLGIAAAKGWVSAPAWGWAQVPPGVVARSAATLLFGDVLLVWNEEQVFRGYGFDTLRSAVGLPLASVTLISLFGVYHGLSPQRVIGTGIGGIALLMLRLGSGGLWLPYGFHLAWNAWQIVVFGPADAAISLRPLHVHGPKEWIGRPGSPEHGWLSMVVRGALCAGLGVWLWGRKRHGK